MLCNDRFPRANEKWEELASSDSNWTKWKTIDRKAEMAEKVKKTAQGGQDQFGAHGAFKKEGAKGVGVPQLSIEALDGYFDSLANAATTEKEKLPELVKSNATLTTINTTLTASIAGFQKQLGTIGRGTTPRKDPAGLLLRRRSVRSECNCRTHCHRFSIRS